MERWLESYTCGDDYDYESPDGSIFASLYKFSGGTHVLKIHFLPEIDQSEQNSITQTKYVLRVGISAFLDLIDALENSRKFEHVKFVIGVTNKTMAKFTVRRLGFYYYKRGFKRHEPELDFAMGIIEDMGEKKDLILGDRIFISKEELLKKKACLEELQRKLSRR